MASRKFVIGLPCEFALVLVLFLVPSTQCSVPSNQYPVIGETVLEPFVSGDKSSMIW